MRMRESDDRKDDMITAQSKLSKRTSKIERV
jgi:hypothetical protein